MRVAGEEGDEPIRHDGCVKGCEKARSGPGQSPMVTAAAKRSR